MSSFRSRIRGRKPSSAATGPQQQQTAAGGEEEHLASTDTSTNSAGTESSINDSSMETPPDVLLHTRCISESAKEEEERQRREIKDQVILTDPKYKANRVEKSSSRSRVVPLTSRKISAPPVMEGPNGTSKGGGAPSGGASGAAAAPKKSARSHSHLNLNSLLKYKSLLYAGSGSADKKLTSEDFDKMRKKSMSEVAMAAQPNSDSAGSVKLIRHELIDEVDDDAAACEEDGEGSGSVPPSSSSAKMSLSEKVAAKLNESKKKRSKSKARKRRGSRRSSCNSSAVNIPVVLANRLSNRDEAEGEDEEAEVDGLGGADEGDDRGSFSLGGGGGWFYSHLLRGGSSGFFFCSDSSRV